MNKLLKEFLSYVLEARKKSQNTTPREPKRKVGDIWQPIDRETKQRSTTWSAKRADRVQGGFPTRADAQDWLDGKRRGKKPADNTPGKEPADRLDGRTAQDAARANADAERAFRQGRVGTSGAGKPPTKTKRQKKASKPAVTADHGIDPVKDSVSTVIGKLIESAKKLVGARRRGEAGAGGPRPSYGEASLTELANRLMEGGSVTEGLRAFRTQNSDQIEAARADIEAKLNDRNKRTRDSYERRVNALGNILGLDPTTDREDIIEYMAVREAYVAEELKRLKADPNSVFYGEGDKGFDGDEEAVAEWARTAFDGAIATAIALRASSIDTSKPFVVLQSEETGHDSAMKATLEAKLKEAEAAGDEEARAHYQKQLEVWNHTKFRDTMVVGEDKNGRMVVFHITNKKNEYLKDIWNNSTPVELMSSLLAKFKEEREGISEEDKEGFKVVARVIEEAVEMCEDATIAVTDMWETPDLTIDAELVDFIHEHKLGKYVDDVGQWMQGAVTSPRTEAAREFKDWAATPAGKVKMDRLNDACKGKKSVSRECTEARLSTMHAFMNDPSRKRPRGVPPKSPAERRPPFKPIGKLLSKIGEVKKLVDKKSGAKPTGALAVCVTAKETESSAVEKAHELVVDTIKKHDDDLCARDSSKCPPPNGPATRMYLEQAMHNMHFDYMITNMDGHMAAVTGARTSRPEDFRQTLAERSGFTEPEPKDEAGRVEWRRKLNEHIVNTATISPTSRSIVIRSGTSDEFELVEDSWRSSGGGSQKVQKNIGKAVAQGVIASTDSRASANKAKMQQMLAPVSAPPKKKAAKKKTSRGK